MSMPPWLPAARAAPLPLPRHRVCSADPARMAIVAMRVAALLADMPAEQCAELLSARAFLARF